MKSDMTIGRKLLIGFGVSLGLTFLMSLIGLSNIGRLGATVDTMAGLETKKQALLV